VKQRTVYAHFKHYSHTDERTQWDHDRVCYPEEKVSESVYTCKHCGDIMPDLIEDRTCPYCGQTVTVRRKVTTKRGKLPWSPTPAEAPSHVRHR
jgi:rubrerythrin